MANPLFKVLAGKKSEKLDQDASKNLVEAVDKNMDIKEATQYVQQKIFDDSENYTDANKDFSGNEDKQYIIRKAMAGDRKAYLEIKKIIEDILTSDKIKVAGHNTEEAVEKIYSQTWGLGVVDKYYRNDEVDEIRVNGPENIYIIRKGRSERASEKFENEASVEQVIKRMITEDVGLSLDRSSPRAESVRMDGSRLTATCFPVSKTWTFVLRKHGTFKMTLDNLIKARTLDQKVWEVLKVLVRGRANILFSGNVGAGKTSLMRKLIENTDPALRILVIGKDLELRLSGHYPDKDIIELEEHEHVGASMKALFETALRESPDCIIIEEFRGAGEAVEAIRACTRGHFGSMASAHFNNAEEAVEGTAMMMLEEGLNLPLDLAKLRVARAFNVVVQMYGDVIAGVKKLIRVTEILVNDKNEICYIPLIEWAPSSDDFMGEGAWKFKKRPSDKLLSHMLKTVPREQIENIGWDTSCITCGT